MSSTATWINYLLSMSCSDLDIDKFVSLENIINFIPLETFEDAKGYSGTEIYSLLEAECDTVRKYCRERM